jgi:hypothetical protein
VQRAVIMNTPLARAIALVLPLLLAACASPPDARPGTTPSQVPAPTPAKTAPADTPASADSSAARPDDEPAPPGQTRYKWSRATEADVAAALDKKFHEAAKQFVQLKRNDQVMFCKRYRDIGSMIPTLHCITEAELRKQVEDSDQVREQMRHKMGKCDITVGCSAGG